MADTEAKFTAAAAATMSKFFWGFFFSFFGLYRELLLDGFRGEEQLYL